MTAHTTTPFRSERMNRWNGLAEKANTPLFTVGYRVLSVFVFMVGGVALYAGKQWLDERIAKNPVVYNVGTRLEDLAKRGDEATKKIEANERAIVSISATQEKVSAFLRENVKGQEAIKLQLGVLTQKVDDGQLRAADAEKRIDTTLNEMRRTR